MTSLRLHSRVLARRRWSRHGDPGIPGRRPGVEPRTAPTPVPWRVRRGGGGHVIELENCGATPLRAVRLSLAGPGVLGVTLPRTVRAGERLRAVLRGIDERSLLVVRWFEPDGTEMLWHVVQ